MMFSPKHSIKTRTIKVKINKKNAEVNELDPGTCTTSSERSNQHAATIFANIEVIHY